MDKVLFKIEQSPLVEVAYNYNTNQIGILLEDIETEYGRVLLVYIDNKTVGIDFDNVCAWMIRDVGIIKTMPREEYQRILYALLGNRN